MIALWAIALFALPSLFFISAPYGGRFTVDRSRAWGPGIPARLAWVLMELPASVCFLWAWLQGPHRGEPLAQLFLALFLAHYFQRTVVFPLRMRASGRRNPIGGIAMGFGFNILNGFANGYAVSTFAPTATAWLTDPRFIGGLLLFATGMAINLHADAVLRALRKPGETGYKIPRGGLYRFVSSPAYLGEIIEWTGWALATSTAAGLAFAVATVANLAPRAWSSHQWYREQFPDYPPERKALLPGLW